MSEESFNPSNEPFPLEPDDSSDSLPAGSDQSLPKDSGPIEQTPMPESGNRPASGARQILPGEAFTQDFFKGSENAGDFLGLDAEFTGSWEGDAGLDLEQAPQLAAPLPEASDTGYVPGKLLEEEIHVDDGTGVEYLGSGEEDEDDHDDESIGEEEYAGDDIYAEGELFGEGEEYVDEELDEELAQPRSRKGLLVVAGALVLLAVVGATYGPQLWSPGDADGTEVATGPTDPVPTNTTDPAPIELGSDPLPGPEVAVADPDPVVPNPVDPDPVDSAPVELFDPIELTTGEDPGVELDPTTVVRTDPTPEGFEDLLGGLEDVLQPLAGQGPENDPLTEIARLLRLGTGPGASGGFPDFNTGFDWVTEDMLDMIWRGQDVPMEAIAAPARTLMPYVGNVRVLMSSGEVFEGRLYAVGQHRVWIDTQPGRLGLDGDQVVKFERLSNDVTVGAGPAATGGRVRVRAPGGMLYGKILAINGNLVTIVSDEGGKITLKNPDMEPLGSNRAIVVNH